MPPLVSSANNSDLEAEEMSDGSASDHGSQVSARSSKASRIAMLPVRIHKVVVCKLCTTRCDEQSPVPIEAGVTTGGFIQWFKYSGHT